MYTYSVTMCIYMQRGVLHYTNTMSFLIYLHHCYIIFFALKQLCPVETRSACQLLDLIYTFIQTSNIAR